MEIKAPENIKDLLDEVVQSFRSFLGDNLVGIYLHGSLAMGSYNRVSSDIDFLVVVQEKLSLDAKKEIGRIMLKLSLKSPAEPSHGLEMSVIVLDALQNFVHPAPYELHFSNSNKQDFVNEKIDFAKETFDPDLAAHIVIIRKRGICLSGEPIAKIFPDVPKKFYLSSIIYDIEWSLNNIIAKGPDNGECAVPVYAVLNFCRVLAFIDQELVTSKLEAGQWGLKYLPKEYHFVIQEALNEYVESGTGKSVNASALKKFGDYVRSRLLEVKK